LTLDVRFRARVQDVVGLVDAEALEHVALCIHSRSSTIGRLTNQSGRSYEGPDGVTGWARSLGRSGASLLPGPL
jgi:hypothetical protein